MDQRLIEPYLESTKAILMAMTGIEITQMSEPIDEEEDFISLGVSSSVAWSGKIKGRFVFDMSPELAKVIVGRLMGQDITLIKDRLYLSGISEMNNTIAGDANTFLNNTYKLGLRLAPPIVFAGKNIVIASSKIDAVTINCETGYGALKLNVAFQGGIE